MAEDKKMHTLKGASVERGLPMERAPRQILPSFSIADRDLPRIKEAKVGDKIRLEIETEVVTIEKDEYADGQPITASLRIHKIRDLTLSEEEKRARKGHE